MTDLRRIETVLGDIENQLLDEVSAHGHWEGRLSSSALATAVAIVALLKAEPHMGNGAVRGAVSWLESDQNPDGGWGDSPESRSNLSTTLLCWSALQAAGHVAEIDQRVVDRAQQWLSNYAGGVDGGKLASAVLGFYGNDRTFSAPILLMAQLCGCLGDDWRVVPQLPLELAAVPRRFFKWLRLPVVSYAIPALVAVGLARHSAAPSRFMPLRWLRNLLIPDLLHTLKQLQPANGGYLEAAPLTGFVVMGLAAAGRRDNPVVDAGVRFLRQTQRADGSWPIDTNLATWVTTRAVEALAAGTGTIRRLPEIDRLAVRSWLVDQQHTAVHVFTGAAPGGWAWTDLPGAVPDADDTAGALLAIRRLATPCPSVRKAAAAGVKWLLDLQNRDGGIPTFCRGWARLPFDRSCPDITAHALRAWWTWRGDLGAQLTERLEAGIRRALVYLACAQSADGSWLPLWFGNQWQADEGNPVYGTAQVVEALNEPDLATLPRVQRMVVRARDWLVSVQNPDGGWGLSSAGSSTIEETSLALSVLADTAELEVIQRGASWLVSELTARESVHAEPIGLYFASLWYSESLYPVVFSASALRRVAKRLARSPGYSCNRDDMVRRLDSDSAWQAPLAVGE